jgi:hypothetical protein
MTAPDTTALRALKGDPSGRKTRKPEWTPLDLQTLHPGVYLAADPSLTATGLVLFQVTPELKSYVHIAQKLGAESGDKGWETTLTQATQLKAQLDHWINHWVGELYGRWELIHAVHEAPPSGGGKIMRPESSALGGFAFRLATIGMHRLPMVQRQTHAKLICGNGNAIKRVEHESLKGLLPLIPGSEEFVTNEATRDALCVALTAAHRGY